MATAPRKSGNDTQILERDADLGIRGEHPMTTRLAPVAFDIETTGFGADAVVTAAGLALPLGVRLFVNTNGESISESSLEQSLESAVDETVQLSSHEDEPALLSAMSTFVREQVSPREYMLVAYNGERYQGGFDLPFLRTRLVAADRPWPFVDVPFADLQPIFRRQFNTVVEEEPVRDLVSIYSLLVDGPYTELDPFEDSQAAVTAFETGDFEALLRHNLADVLRTDALAKLAQQYCSNSDFRLKSLSPSAAGEGARESIDRCQ